MINNPVKRLLQILPVLLAVYALVMIGHGVTVWTGQVSPNNQEFQKPLTPCPRGEAVVIHQGTGEKTVFAVEIAQTEDQQAYGLMFRDKLEPLSGMFFPFEPPRKVNFWMKNTLIPLDLVFVGKDNMISHISANAVPKSLFSISSNGPVAGVLEIAGGEAARLDLKVGDVLHLKPE